MNDKQKRFVIEYCKDENGTQAAIRAGYSEHTAEQIAYQLLQKTSVQEAVSERMEEIATAAAITVEAVLKVWWDIATANPNELMQLRNVNCRHCWGNDHLYQWTENEYRQVVDEAINKGQDAPDGMGGFGFLVNSEPNPACPECGGNGVELLHFEDTRKLTGKAKRLYAGVQKTKDGLKVLTRDQDAALLNISRYLGMMVDRKELSGPGGAPLSVVHSMKAEDLTDDQLAMLIKPHVKPE